MKSDSGLIPARPGTHPKPVDDKVGQLPSASPERFDLGEIALLLEFEHAAVKHHRGAGAARHYHRILAREHANSVANDLARRGPVAAVERGLTAARLRLREHHLDPQMLEHFH